MLDLFLLMYNTTLDTFDIYEIFGLAFTINVHNWFQTFLKFTLSKLWKLKGQILFN